MMRVALGFTQMLLNISEMKLMLILAIFMAMVATGNAQESIVFSKNLIAGVDNRDAGMENSNIEFSKRHYEPFTLTKISVTFFGGKYPTSRKLLDGIQENRKAQVPFRLTLYGEKADGDMLIIQINSNAPNVSVKDHKITVGGFIYSADLQQFASILSILWSEI